MSILRSRGYWADFHRRRRERATFNPNRRPDLDMINPGCRNTPPIWTFTTNGVYMSNVLDNGRLRTVPLSDPSPLTPCAPRGSRVPPPPRAPPRATPSAPTRAPPRAPPRAPTSLKELELARPVHKSTLAHVTARPSADENGRKRRIAESAESAPVPATKSGENRACAKHRLFTLTATAMGHIMSLIVVPLATLHLPFTFVKQRVLLAIPKTTPVDGRGGEVGNGNDDDAHALVRVPRGHFAALSRGITMSGGVTSSDATIRRRSRRRVSEAMTSAQDLQRGERYANFQYHPVLRDAIYRQARRDLKAARAYAALFKADTAPSEAMLPIWTDPGGTTSPRKYYLVTGASVVQPGAYTSWGSADAQYKRAPAATVKGYNLTSTDYSVLAALVTSTDYSIFFALFETALFVALDTAVGRRRSFSVLASARPSTRPNLRDPQSQCLSHDPRRALLSIAVNSEPALKWKPQPHLEPIAWTSGVCSASKGDGPSFRRLRCGTEVL
ncbi:hypothetical protein C8R46DRAFT_1206597 [Mycena filopes]|nr:hypothetical protein C8R46DRAFT_1206597 [Mycena filopes]